MLMPHGPDPIKTAALVKCPVVIKYPIGHFDIYHGDYFEKAVAAQLTFIKSLV